MRCPTPGCGGRTAGALPTCRSCWSEMATSERRELSRLGAQWRKAMAEQDQAAINRTVAAGREALRRATDALA